MSLLLETDLDPRQPSTHGERSAPRRRSYFLSATTLARSASWGGWPAALVALPLALAPSGARAATIFTVGPTCQLPPGTVCNASPAIPAPGSKNDNIDFQGGALTLNGAGLTYDETVTLGTTPTNILNQAGNSTTFGSEISGAGNITIANSGAGGSVTFDSNKNSYTGSTTVDAGATLKLTSKGAIDSSSGLTANGTFDISGGANNVTITDLSGNGTVDLGSNTLKISGATGTFAGGILGTGGAVTITGGNETLSGANSYTGATTISAGATLSISGAGSIASSSKLADNGTFDITGANAPGVTITSLSGGVSGVGGGSVLLGGNTLTLSQASGTFSGTISGTGGVTVAAGTETFDTAPKTYSGTSTINSGATLLLSGAGAIPNSSVVDNGTFDIASTTGTSIPSLSGSGGVNLGAQNLALTNASGIFTGVATGIGGSLTIGKGIQTLNGANTYTGATTVSSGATLTGTGSVAGNVVNNGTVRPFDTVSNKAATFTIAGSYARTGGQSDVLNIAIGGLPASGNYSKLAVKGAVALGNGVAGGGGSTLDVDTNTLGFSFPFGDTTYADILTFGSVTGDFTSFSYNGTACTSGGSETWLCGGNTTFTEMFRTTALDLLVTRAPEPGTLAVLATGLLGLMGIRRRWR